MKHTARKEKSSMWDVLSLGTFCLLGRFVPWDVKSLGHFVPWDVLSLGTFCPLGSFVFGTFFTWDVLSLGPDV